MDESIESYHHGDDKFLVHERRTALAEELKEENALKLMERKRMEMNLNLDLQSDIMYNHDGQTEEHVGMEANFSDDLLNSNMQHDSTLIASSTDSDCFIKTDYSKSMKANSGITNEQNQNLIASKEQDSHRLSSIPDELEPSIISCEEYIQQCSAAATVEKEVSLVKNGDEFRDSMRQIHDSNMNIEHQTQFYRQVRSGFKLSLQSMGDPISLTQEIRRMPTVNFIDPTSVLQNQGSVASVSESSPSRRRAWNREKIKPRINHLQIFDKFNTIFQERYCSTLEKINYRDPLTNEINVIKKLPIQTKLTAPMVVDTVDWHEEPLCHVYIAACYSMDHYKEKVGPSIKAFVNQIDGAASGNELDVISAASFAAKKEFGAKKNSDNKRVQVDAASRAVAAAKDAACSITSSHYMIIFVPINPSSVETESYTIDDVSKENGVGLRGRLAAATRRTQSKDPNDDETNLDSNKDDETLASQVIFLSKEHREIYKKIRTDFERGRTSILSTLLDSENNLLDETPIQNQEFHAIMQELGKSLLSGFYDRINRYTQELNRFNTAEFSWHQQETPFHWSRFFLLKESLSFSFEQMQLPNEAVREYGEIASSLPSGNCVSIPKSIAVSYDSAASCDSSAFRLFLKQGMSCTDDLYDILMLYISSRQAHLFFLHGDPVRAVMTLFDYVQRNYMFRRRLLESSCQKDSECLHIKIEMWAVSLCKDITSALDIFCAPLLDTKVSNKTYDINPQLDHISHALMNVMRNVLEFARFHAVKLNQLLFCCDNVINSALIGRFHRDHHDSLPWDSAESSDKVELCSSKSNTRKLFKELSIFDNDTMVNPFLLDAFQSEEKYRLFVVNIYKELLTLNNFLCRQRSACRILMDLAEISISLDDAQTGIDELFSMIEIISANNWDTLLSWVLFRLLFCQRKLKTRTEYFNTLTNILGYRLAKRLPKSVSHVLLMQMKKFVQNFDQMACEFALEPLFHVHARVEGIKDDFRVMHKCHIGESVLAIVDLSSALIEAIEADEICLLLLNTEHIDSNIQSFDIPVDSKSTLVLKTDESITIKPGKNTISFPWVPTIIGHFLISSVRLRWGHTCFRHDFKLKGHQKVLGFTVESCMPTNSATGITERNASSVHSCGDISVPMSGSTESKRGDLSLSALNKSGAALDLSFLKTDQVSIHRLDSDESVISVFTVLDSPTPLHLKRAYAILPECLKLCEDGDISHKLIPETLVLGDEFSLIFRCLRNRSVQHSHYDAGKCHARIHLVFADIYQELFSQVIKVETSSICSEIDRDTGAVIDARLSCSKKEGLITEPVLFTYRLSKMNYLRYTNPASSSISYSLDSDCESWFVAGALKGSIPLQSEDDNYDLHFVAIPIRCGIIERFPSLHLSCEDTGTIKIDIMYPVSYECKPFSQIDEISCLSASC